MSKCLSIITNFGCHFTCPYCIVKNNNINVPPTTVESLDHLKAAVEEVGATKISVSGGGDPLHNFNHVYNTDYYFKLFDLAASMKLPVDIHTSYINCEYFPYYMCNRVVYHCRDIKQLRKIRRYGNEKVRVVFVVTEDFTASQIESIAIFVKYSDQIDELSFRQMVGKDYQATDYWQQYLKGGHNEGRWFYIEQDDYNVYFVNGKIYHEFAKIGSDVDCPE